MDDVRVEHDRDGRRFHASLDGHGAVLIYRLADGVMEITHTGVPTAIEGRGVAGALVRAAVEAAKAEGWKVDPQCAYAESWFKRHKEYADLMA
jgi:predicted GNAT family acetyltransferase